MAANDVILTLAAFLNAFWLFIPAYLPNSAAVIFGGGKKMDFGLTFFDGLRILGDGKTWRGFFGGWLSGIFIGLIEILLSHPFDPHNHLGFGPFPMALMIVLVLPFSSVFGDVVGSFIKRRLGLHRGERAPILDQYDFFIMTVIIMALAFPTWFYRNFIDGVRLWGFIILIIFTYFLQRAVNIVGYKMGKKKEPW